MTTLQAVILGIVEGITEFLPISSTGHLILASDLLGVPDSEFLKTFEISIQLGAVSSVIFLFWRRIVSSSDLFRKVAVAFLPTALIGLAAYPFVKGYLLGSEQVVLWALFLGGAFLFHYERYFPKPAVTVGLDKMSYRQAFGIGLVQSISIIPGVSRAAATIVGGLVLGLDRKSVVEFSFLLAIPTMAAATGLDLYKSGSAMADSEWGILAIGFVVSFAVAAAAVKWLIKYIETHDFSSFGLYRIALAALFWIWFM